jgi:glutathionylspermidine synthase
MNTVPYSISTPLPRDDWKSLRLALMFDYSKWDIQSEDHSVVADFPLLLPLAEWRALAMLAEKLSQELIAAEKDLLIQPRLHDRLGLPQSIYKTLAKCPPKHIPTGVARIMRFDFHFTTQGWQISEVNADVPGGFVEASGLNTLMSHYYPGCVAPPDPASAYLNAIGSAVDREAVIGLVHATAHSDDRQVMEFLSRGLRERTLRPIFIAPTHLRWESGRAVVESSFASARPALLIRFFPAEWLVQMRQTLNWRPWFCGGKTSMSNPASAILVQSKRFPLVWDEIGTSLPTWRSLLPETRCPSEIALDSGEWVVKPVFGRVGEDVAINGVTPEQSRREILKEAKRHPPDWVAQRRFDAVPVKTHDGARYASCGVFTLDAHAVGVYGRIARKPLIDHDAQDIAVLLT